MKLDKRILPYTDLLRPGHWDAFLNYAWQCTDCGVVSGHSTPSSWRHLAAGKEEEELARLFEASDHQLHTILDEYFASRESDQKDHCQRCNTGFASPSTELCRFCGWDRQYVTDMEGDALDKMIAINSNLNGQRLKSELAVFIAQQNLNLLEPGEEGLLAECKRLGTEVATTATELAVLADKVKGKKESRARLELESRVLADEIEELAENLKNSVSLFNLYEPLSHSKTLNLKTVGGNLMAYSLPEFTFPADLIMALKSTRIPNQEVVKNASCFIFLKKNEWQNAGTNTWLFDIQKGLAGKVTADTYHAEFYHLHEDHSYKINFSTSKLTIR